MSGTTLDSQNLLIKEDSDYNKEQVDLMNQALNIIDKDNESIVDLKEVAKNAANKGNIIGAGTRNEEKIFQELKVRSSLIKSANKNKTVENVQTLDEYKKQQAEEAKRKEEEERKKQEEKIKEEKHAKQIQDLLKTLEEKEKQYKSDLENIKNKEPTLYEKIQDIHKKIGEDLDPVELATGDIDSISKKALENLKDTKEYTDAIQDLNKFKEEHRLGFQPEDLLIFPAFFNGIKNLIKNHHKILKAKEDALKTYETINASKNKSLTELGKSIDTESQSESASELLKSKSELNLLKVDTLRSSISNLEQEMECSSSLSKASTKRSSSLSTASTKRSSRRGSCVL